MKLSGESLGGPEGRGLDTECLKKYSREIAQAVKAGLQIAIVNGGGNIFRGLQGLEKDLTELTGIGWACWRRSSTPLRSNSSLRMKG